MKGNTEAKGLSRRCCPLVPELGPAQGAGIGFREGTWGEAGVGGGDWEDGRIWGGEGRWGF